VNPAVFRRAAGQVMLGSAPMPGAPLDNQLRVRMLHAPINPADLLAIDGRYAFDLESAVPIGAEGVGVVEAAGDAIDDLRVGDRVLPLSRGNWCRYRLLDRSDVVFLPPDIDAVQAAMLRINPATAWLLLRSCGAEPGDVVVQNAATSAVAHWVRRLAPTFGITVIDVVRRPDPALPDALRDGDDLPDRVQAAAQGGRIGAALDCVAGAATGRMAACLATGGRLMLFGHLSGEPLQVASQVMTAKGISITGFSLRPSEAALGVEGRRAMFAALAGIHAADPPDLPVRAVLPLSRAEEAIAQARSGEPGRVLFDLSC
jgi:NADPH:quinone reductase-like Zn-dependent oxidoreductase